MRHLVMLIAAVAYIAGIILGWVYAWWLGILAIWPPIAYFITVYHILVRTGLLGS